MKRHSTSLEFKEMQNKTTMKYHYTLIRMAKIFKATTPNAGDDAEKHDHSYIASENVKWYSPSEKHSLAIS